MQELKMLKLAMQLRISSSELDNYCIHSFILAIILQLIGKAVHPIGCFVISVALVIAGSVLWYVSSKAKQKAKELEDMLFYPQEEEGI